MVSEVVCLHDCGIVENSVVVEPRVGYSAFEMILRTRPLPLSNVVAISCEHSRFVTVRIFSVEFPINVHLHIAPFHGEHEVKPLAHRVVRATPDRSFVLGVPDDIKRE
jgi:hypothetical protein